MLDLSTSQQNAMKHMHDCILSETDVHVHWSVLLTVGPSSVSVSLHRGGSWPTPTAPGTHAPSRWHQRLQRGYDDKPWLRCTRWGSDENCPPWNYDTPCSYKREEQKAEREGERERDSNECVCVSKASRFNSLLDFPALVLCILLVTFKHQKTAISV